MMSIIYKKYYTLKIGKSGNKYLSMYALIEHYQKTLGAVMISKNRMAIFEDRALLLLEKYSCLIFPKLLY